jgi:hypothetical protein
MAIQQPSRTPGANLNQQKYLSISADKIKNNLSLRSTYPDSGRLGQISEEPAVPNKTYFSGGARDSRNYCSFSLGNTQLAERMSPKTITLYLSPNNVTWRYQLRTNVIDTYGGQVVQILGVSIEDLTIRGYFGNEGMWGFENDEKGNYSSRYENGDYKKWKQVDGESLSLRNGMVQLSEWFKTYFYHVTQAGNFEKDNMIFSYPHLNWLWKIRPIDFPRVRFANNELMPQWELKCDFIEDLQNYAFLQQVTESAKKALTRFRDNIGWSEFIEWSQPLYKTQENRKEVARQIATSYSDFIGSDFTEKEIETLITRGFSYPVKELTPHIQENTNATTNARRRLSVIDEINPAEIGIVR